MVASIDRFLGQPGHIIEGTRGAEDGGTQPVEDPATARYSRTSPPGPPVTSIAPGSARAAFREGRWSRLPGIERGSHPHRHAALSREHAEALAELEARDTGPPGGRPLRRRGHAHHFRVLRRSAGSPWDRRTSSPRTAAQRGPCAGCVVGAINPWNFPIAGAGLKGGPILAGGNSMVMKPSNLTSLSTLAVAELALEAGLPPGVFNVVTGSGSVVGGAIARHPDVDIVSFTGGTETGMAVMRDRAEVGRRVQLELGGKSPTIVFEDADLGEAVPAAAFGIFMNQGQNCSGSRILVQESIHDRFVEA